MPHHPISLKVLHPCTRTWDSLAGNHMQRYCDDCDLHVHNASELSNAQVLKLLASPGRVCMSGLAKSDGLLLTKDALRAEARVHLRGRPLLRIAAALGLISIPTALAACTPGVVKSPEAINPASNERITTQPPGAVSVPTDPPRPVYPGIMQRPTPTDTPQPDPTAHHSRIDPPAP